METRMKVKLKIKRKGSQAFTGKAPRLSDSLEADAAGE